MIPQFLLRKLYKKGSLVAENGQFSFTLQNQIKTATITTVPTIVVNGIPQDLKDADCPLDLQHPPTEFTRGTECTLTFPGHLLKGGNRIHFQAETEEFGEIDFLVEDAAAEA